MQQKFYLTSLATSLALTMAISVEAATPMPLQKMPLSTLQHHFQLGLPGVKQVLRAPSPDVLQFVNQHTDKNKMAHVRMQQQYEGFVVFGGYAIIHSQQTSSDVLAIQEDVEMNGVIYQGLQSELGKPSATFIANGALALQQFKAPYTNKIVSEEQVTPMVYIDEQHKAHWAYKVSIFVKHDDQIPERPTAIIDALTYQPFVEWNDVKTAVTTVKGMGFGGNDKVGKIVYGTELPWLELTREDNKCYMQNTDVKIVNMKHKYDSNNQPMAFTCKINKKNSGNVFWTGSKGDGYDRENGAFSPTNDALYAGHVIKHMYQEWYNVPVLKNADDSAMQLVMRVHYGKGYENAYWDGEQMTFGDGDTMMYPLVSLGVGAHEISHGFTEQHAGLEYYGQSGGMNESFSDMAAQAAEFYSSGKNTWMIGSDIMKSASGVDALRYMDMPSKDGESIDSADEYTSHLDVHHSSGVYNRLYYLMSTHANWNAHKAFDVMIKANMDYWTPYSNFTSGACGILSAAKDLGFETDSIKESLTTVAIDYQHCTS